MKLRVKAPAKVNLALEVLGRRRDGYHEIRSVVQTIALSDTVDVENAPELSLLAPAETGALEENLVLRAARLLASRSGGDPGARLTLRKGIPVGAGLGGGSSDAAAALRLLRRLWWLPPSRAMLHALAAGLGSDVPLFLIGGAASLSGRGEQIVSLPGLDRGYFVLVVPRWIDPRKTPRVYAALSADDFGSGRRVGRVAAMLVGGAAPDQSSFYNSLQPAAERVFPSLAGFHHQLELSARVSFTLSGAGPTLFHYAHSLAEARTCADLARPLGARVYLARPLRRLPRIQAV